MSTTTNPQGVPDAGSLQQILSQLFAAPPGNFLNELSAPASFAPVAKDPLLQQGNVTDLRQPQTSHVDPHFPASRTPQSVAGSGISPAGFTAGNAFDLDASQAPVPDSGVSENGYAPASVAGSGISPSAGYQGNQVDLKNPVNSLQDPNRSVPTYPGSGSGAGVSPRAIPEAAQGQGFTTYLDQYSTHPGITPPVPLKLEHGVHVPFSNHHFPHEQEKPFENQLQEALKQIPKSDPVGQLPTSPTGSLPGSYYFLSGNERTPFPGAAGNLQERTATKGISGIASPPFDVNLIRKDFPILGETVNGRPLIWLDNAATTQKPRQVIERISYFYEHENSNIHRAAHELAARATDAYEGAREKVQRFLNARSINEIVFVRGATEGINLVAKSWGAQYLNAGDEIIVSHLEHHANIVPWQQLVAKKGIKLKVIPVDESGQVILEEYAKLLGPKTKLVAFTQVSNALGTITPARQIIAMAHQYGAKVLVDGAQSVSHMRVDVQELDCDWLVFSGHKLFGPTGIGAVYGKEGLLNDTQPWQGGGNMIKDVTFEHTQFHPAPGRFEAGTGNIADAVGLGAAIDYISKIGIELIGQYEHYLLVYATRLLKEVPGVRLIGTAADKASVLSFVLDGYSNDQVGQALNKEGIAVRTGHHCAQPILRRFGLESTVRPSLAFYNTCQEIDLLVSVLHRLRSAKK